MATGQTIETKIVVDAKQAIADVNSFNNKLSSIADIANKPIGSLKELQDGAKNLQQRLGPTAAAISGVASALGQTGGEAAKVVAGVGQMAAAFGAGGPWAVALVGGTMLLDEYMQAQTEITNNSKLWRAALDNIDAAMRDGVNKRTADITQMLKDAQTELRNFGKTSREIREEEARLAIAATERQLQTLEKNLPELQRKGAQSNRTALFYTDDEERERVSALEEVAARATQRQAEYTKQLSEQKKALQETIRINAELAEKEKASRPSGGGGKKEEEDPRYSSKALQDRIKRLMAAQEEARKQAEAEADAAFEADIERMAAAGKANADYERLKTSIAEEEQAKRDELRKQEIEAERAAVEQRNAFLASMASGMVGTMASATQQLIDDIITGQEHAKERFAAFIMQQAGQSLISNGVQLIAEGTKNLLIGNPLGAGQLVGASSLIGMGIGLGGIATGVTHAAAGGTFGQKLPEKSTSERSSDPASRARPSTGMRGTKDGGQNITIVYGGISGPSADDGARALRHAARRADRRGFA